MSVYRVKELLDCLHEIFQQGCEYVEVNAEEDAASFKGIISEGKAIDCKTVASCQYGEEIDCESDDDNCYELQFNYDEIATIASALANMPSIYEKAISDESYDPREREAFRTMAEKMLALKKKMEGAFK